MILKNKVVVVQYKELEYLPPVMNLLLVLQELGRRLVYIGVYSKTAETFLNAHRIEHYYLPYDSSLYENRTFISKIINRIIRAIRFYPCRIVLRRLLKRIKKQNKDITVWFSEIQSAALLGDSWKYYSNRIVTIYELADFYGRTWWGFSFKQFLKEAIIVEPEKNRAQELKRYFNLPQLPLVVANKTHGHPRIYQEEIPSVVRELLLKTNGRPIFLYQGVWTEDRRDVGMFLETLAKNRPNYCVVAMPGRAAVKRLEAKYDNVFSLPYIPPPGHLAATSVASVGIAIYNASGKTDLERKNALFCAPNKIYEYAGFGIPTIGNNIPGLVDTIGRAEAGLCVEMVESDILRAADDLISNITSYRKKANDFFDKVDLRVQISAVLEKAEEGR